MVYFNYYGSVSSEENLSLFFETKFGGEKKIYYTANKKK